MTILPKEIEKMEEKVFFHNSTGSKLCGVLSNPLKNIESPIIILVHGLVSNKNTNNFLRITEALAEEGISTFRIDINGHGESEGNINEITVSEAVDDILRAIDYLKTRGFYKIGLLGSSFGGMSSIIAASKTKDLFLLALKSPVSNYEEKYKKVNGVTFIEEWKLKGFMDYDAGEGREVKLKFRFYEDAVKNNGYKVAERIKIPTLIVHGDEDEQVPVEQSIKISKIIPNCELLIVNGSDHRYTKPLHTQKMQLAFRDFIVNHSVLAIPQQ